MNATLFEETSLAHSSMRKDCKPLLLDLPGASLYGNGTWKDTYQHHTTLGNDSLGMLLYDTIKLTQLMMHPQWVHSGFKYGPWDMHRSYIQRLNILLLFALASHHSSHLCDPHWFSHSFLLPFCSAFIMAIYTKNERQRHPLTSAPLLRLAKQPYINAQSMHTLPIKSSLLQRFTIKFHRSFNRDSKLRTRLHFKIGHNGF